MAAAEGQLYPAVDRLTGALIRCRPRYLQTVQSSWYFGFAMPFRHRNNHQILEILLCLFVTFLFALLEEVSSAFGETARFGF